MITFWLTYKRAPHGTGTNLTRADIAGMELSEILWWWKQLRETWDEEDKANRKG